MAKKAHDKHEEKPEQPHMQLQTEEEEGPKVSKMDAVRAALYEGVEGTKEGIQFVKEKFGVDINETTWASYKSQIKKKQGGGGGGNGVGSRGEKAVTKPQGRKPAPAGNVQDVFACIEAVRKLVDTYGAETVQRSLDVLTD